MNSIKKRPSETRTQLASEVLDNPKKAKWPLKTLFEILPVIIALSVVFSYTTIKGSSDVVLFTPLTEVLAQVPWWITTLMGLILAVGLLGMGWLIFIFSRAPINHDGSNDH